MNYSLVKTNLAYSSELTETKALNAVKVGQITLFSVFISFSREVFHLYYK